MPTQGVWSPSTAMSRAGKPVTDEEAATAPHGPAAPSPDGATGAGLARLSRGTALAGGALLLGVMVMTVVSVFGRYLLNAPIPGDYEITELACGVAVFAFLPYCHTRNGNIVVEFFTEKLRPRHKAALEAVHNCAFTIVAGLITWRLFVGGMHKLVDGETTLYLAIPLHWAYFPALIGAVLLTVVCAVVAGRRLRALRR